MPLRVALAIASGLLLAFAFPNVAIGWLIFVAPIPLFIALTLVRGGWESFFLGWISMTTAWLLMVPWIVRVMSHYGGLPYLTGVLLFLALAILLGLYGGLFGWIFWRIAPGPHFRRWLLIPVAWAAVEYVRTLTLTGVPWNYAVAAIVDYTPLIQFDRVAGPYAMAVLILLPATLAAWWITQRPHAMHATVVSGMVVIVCFAWWMTGLVAAKMIARPLEAPTVRAALVQPNISQEMRWNDSNLMQIFQRMIQMTDDAVQSGATVIVWPESTVPLSYATTDFFRKAVETISRTHGVDIILGSVALDAQDPERIWNAAFLVSGGSTIGHYDKMHLVPFGEYVPLRKMLFFAHKLTHTVGTFEFGTNDQPLVGLLRYGPAICYEIVFPQIARAQVLHGAEVLVTITNDAWYDGTSAPQQHLNQARLRAVETDRYLLRAGTTGISALIDPTGRIVDELPMNRQGIVRGTLQPRHSTTPYVRFGDWFAWCAMGIVLIAIVVKKR
jgi:apolipoprotein N-acyltransferase